MNKFRLDGKTIIITGASSGIGRSCAIECSKMGARIALISRNMNMLQETLSLMDQEEDHAIFSYDLTDFENINLLVSDIVSKMGKISGLIHCAGISSTLPIKLATLGNVSSVFSTNVFAAYLFTKELLKKSAFDKGGSSIIFISSIMGWVGENGKSIYSMSKGALNGGCKSLAIELAKKRIRVNTISPGAIETPINQNASHMSDPEKRIILEKAHPLGLGSVEDIANASIFLLSDSSRWITGTDLRVDGGYTAK